MVETKYLNVWEQYTETREVGEQDLLTSCSPCLRESTKIIQICLICIVRMENFYFERHLGQPAWPVLPE